MTMIVATRPTSAGRRPCTWPACSRGLGDDLVVGAVIPAPWIPGMARVDAEYRSSSTRRPTRRSEGARENLPGDVPATFVRHRARSAPAGLLELAEEHDARMIVLGSSSPGAFGHVALGSVTDRLLHSSPVALALAPRGFRCKPDAKIRA